MAYSAANPLRQILQAGFSNTGSSIWRYDNGADDDITTADYFQNVAGYGGLGVKQGDLLVNVSSTGVVTWHSVTAISAGGLRTPQHATVSAA